MKYRSLNITFDIESTEFKILSLCLEKLINPIPMHSHSKNSYELHYISFGNGTLISNGVSYDITPGTLFMTGPNVEHEQISDPENPMTEYCVYLKIEQPPKTERGSLAGIFADKVFWFGQDSKDVHELMKKTFSELESPGLGSKLFISSLMQQLILYMIRIYQAEDEKEGVVSGAKEQIDLTYLIIEEEFLYNYKDVTLKSLSEKLKLSCRQTERLLCRHYNSSFQQKKTQARMFAAGTLLREGKKSILEISQELGYSSGEHFASTFKKYYGITPTQYKKQA